MTRLSDNPVAHLTEYELRHLAEHLEASGRREDLHHVLALETSGQRNAWYEAKEAVGDTAGFLANVARAWRLVEESYSPAKGMHTGQSIGLQNRYALIAASINSLMENVPPVLASALVEHRMWPPAQGLAHAWQMSGITRRMKTLVKLIPQLPREEQTRVLRESR